MADQSIADLPGLPAPTTLQELTFYTVVGQGASAVDYSITGYQLLALIRAELNPSADSDELTADSTLNTADQA